jgi:hypothetical protein
MISNSYRVKVSLNGNFLAMYWEHFVLFNPLFKSNFFVVLMWGLIRFFLSFIIEKEWNFKNGKVGSMGKYWLMCF